MSFLKVISDHDMIFCTRNTIKISQVNIIPKIRSMKNYSTELFLEELRKINFPDYSTFQCVNNAYTVILLTN